MCKTSLVCAGRRCLLRHQCASAAVLAEAEAEMAARLLRVAARASALCRVSPAPVLTRGMAAGGERINNGFISIISGFMYYFALV